MLTFLGNIRNIVPLSYYMSALLYHYTCPLYFQVQCLPRTLKQSSAFKPLKRDFTEFPEGNSKWKCRCGKILTQKPNTSWSNLFQRVKSQHSDYSQDAQSTLRSFVVSKPASMKKAANIYSWLEGICCGLKLFNFVNANTVTWRSLRRIR